MKRLREIWNYYSLPIQNHAITASKSTEVKQVKIMLWRESTYSHSNVQRHAKSEKYNSMIGFRFRILTLSFR